MFIEMKSICELSNQYELEKSNVETEQNPPNVSTWISLKYTYKHFYKGLRTKSVIRG